MKKRDVKIDLLKSIACVLMSFVHINSLFYSEKGLLDSITFLGATVCFSMFLFAISFIQGRKMQGKTLLTWKKVLRSSLSIYVAYLFLGFISILIFKPEFEFIDIVQMAVFAYLPNYVEFLVAFIFFYVFAKLAYVPLRKGIEKPYILISFVISAFAVSMVCSKIDVVNPLLYWLQKHLFGSFTTGVHSFPLFPYMPIYISGLLLSKYGGKVVYAWVGSLSFLALVLLEPLGGREWYRWPPSLAFVLYGLLFISLLMFLFEYVKESNILQKVTLFGRYPLLSWVFLTLFSLLLKMIINGNLSAILTWLLNIAVLILAYACICLSKRSH